MGRSCSGVSRPENSIRHVAEHVHGVAFSPDGRLLATAGSTTVVSIDGREIVPESRDRLDSTVKLWDITDGSLTRAIGKPDISGVINWERGSLGYICAFSAEAVAFSPDGKLLASGHSDGVTTIWSAETGKAVRQLKGHDRNVDSVAFSPRGEKIATGSRDGSIKVWDASTARQLDTFKGDHLGVWSVCFSPDGRKLAAACTDYSVRLWSIDTSKQYRDLRGHEMSVLSVAFSPDGNTLASGGGDGRINLWDIDSGVRKRSIREHAGPPVRSVAYSPDGTLLASASLSVDGQRNRVLFWGVSSSRATAATQPEPKR